MERMLTVNVKEARTCFVQAATPWEEFGDANAVKHLVELEFPQLEQILSTIEV